MQPSGSVLAFVNYETGQFFTEILKKFSQEKTRRAENWNTSTGDRQELKITEDITLTS